MEDEYGMGDLRHYIDGRPAALFPPPAHHQYPFDVLMFRSDSEALPAAGGLISGAGRWPRQETLTLLEIRSRLDPKFKEANQKGPFWDEVSRIMSEEHGYQRSGKKCREKFENLYKYYKKTKEGKAGRQDGKHYRFFRQLEAIYGESSNSASAHGVGGATFPYNNTIPNSSNAGSKISDPDSCECDTTTTSSYCTESNVKKRRSLKGKIEQSIDAQMKSMMEKQEAWMEQMTRVMEGKEREREIREEQWRKQDAARIEREHKMWASERAWIEARDVALMDAFNRLTPAWAETSEVARLIQLRSGTNISEEYWDEKMGGRSGFMCDQINKRKENDDYYNNIPISDQGLINTAPSADVPPIPNDGFFRYFIGESYHQRL